MINLQDLQEKVPALFSTVPIDGVSKNYSFIPTFQVIQEFLNKGWLIRDASQKRTIKANLNRLTFKKHFVRMYHPDQKQVVNGDELNPELVFMNSHDKSSAYRIKLGIIRFICWNGLVSGTTYAAFKLTHYNLAQNKLDGFHAYLETYLPQLIGSIKEWSETKVIKDLEDRFIEEAIKLRFDNNKTVNLDDINLVRRQQDNDPTLWTLFNRVQENLTLGGFKVVNPDNNKARKARAIKDPERNVRFNQDLWDLASRYNQEINSYGSAVQTKSEVQ